MKNQQTQLFGTMMLAIVIFNKTKTINFICMETSEQNNAINGSLPLDESHMCFEKGHAFYLVCEIDNGRSKYGDHKCSRCGYTEPFQYDYGTW